MSWTTPMIISAEEYKKLRFSFSRALDMLKEWYKVTRDWFWEWIHIEMKQKDYMLYEIDWKIEKLYQIPHIIMVKIKKEKNYYFPTDLSCESIFANDRYEVE